MYWLHRKPPLLRIPRLLLLTSIQNLLLRAARPVWRAILRLGEVAGAGAADAATGRLDRAHTIEIAIDRAGPRCQFYRRKRYLGAPRQTTGPQSASAARTAKPRARSMPRSLARLGLCPQYHGPGCQSRAESHQSYQLSGLNASLLVGVGQGHEHAGGAGVAGILDDPMEPL